MNYKHLHYFWTVARAGSIARASDKLHITPQTLSGQIKLLEDRLGAALFRKAGRRLELTDTGRVALSYAEEIFTLGAELESHLRGGGTQGRPLEFKVGIADSVPKSVAFRLLEPATRLPEAVRMVCREGALDHLVSELALHRLDLVLSDRPVPAGLSLKVFNHRLGQSGVSFFAAPALAKRCKGSFPACMEGMPFLCMSDETAQWSALHEWLAREKLQVLIVGEFDDGALMKAFGSEGQGIFMSPTVLEAEICEQYKVRAIGRTTALQESFYAISAERRIRHPCVSAITDTARRELFAEP